MKIAIIEDEPLAAERLTRYLQKINGNIAIMAVLPSLSMALPWISEHKDEVDLFFMDVQLGDGLSFELFSQTQIEKPIIFTTAFDEFAIDAFKVNSIDYLLKPITFTDLSRALKKMESVQQHYSGFGKIGETAKQLVKQPYKQRFLVKIGNHIKSIDTENIMAFKAEGRDVSLLSNTGKEYVIDYKLETLESLLDSKSFFRVNRSFIVRLRHINDVVVYSNRRLKLTLSPAVDDEIVVSREKVGAFKQWFDGN